MKPKQSIIVKNDLSLNRKTYSGKPVQKDYYKKIFNIIKKNKFKSVLDIGCASGDFSFFSPKNCNVLGIDIDRKLIEKAKKKNKIKNKKFRCINIFKTSSKKTKKFYKKYLNNFDLITLFGTFHLFRDYKKTIKVLAKFKPKMIVIITFINMQNYDVNIFHKHYKKKFCSNSFNFFAYKNIIKKFKKMGYSSKFIPYVMNTTLKKSLPIDNIRKYHLFQNSRKKFLVCNLGLFFKEYFIISKKID